MLVRFAENVKLFECQERINFITPPPQTPNGFPIIKPLLLSNGLVGSLLSSISFFQYIIHSPYSNSILSWIQCVITVF